MENMGSRSAVSNSIIHPRERRRYVPLTKSAALRGVLASVTTI